MDMNAGLTRIPAPPEGSLPSIVNTAGKVCGWPNAWSNMPICIPLVIQRGNTVIVLELIGPRSNPWACRGKFSRLLVLVTPGLKVGQIRGVRQTTSRCRRLGLSVQPDMIGGGRL